MLKHAVMIAVLGFGMNAFANDGKREASAKLGAAKTSEITFDKGQAALTESAKSEIRQIVEETKASGQKIDELKVAVWSDREYPTEAQAKNVPKADIELAKKREQAIKNYVKKDLSLDVETFNMTERPNALQRFMSTETSDVKKTLEARGSAPASDETGMFDHKGKASKAVIMVFTE